MEQTVNSDIPQPVTPISPQQASSRPRKPMSLVKKVFVIVFGTVCLFGVWDAFFPSKPPTTATQTPSVTPTPASGWKAFTNTSYHYSVKYPATLELVQQPPYSLIFRIKQAQTTSVAFPELYVSVIPDGFINENNTIYNFIPVDVITSFESMKDGDSRQTQTGTNAQYWIYKKLATIPVADTNGVMVENDKVLNGGSGLKERRVLIKRNGVTYMIGSYYQTQQELDDFHNFILSFTFSR